MMPRFRRYLIIGLVVGGLAASLGRAEPLFPDAAYPVGKSPADVVMADLNYDGFLDLAVANSGSDDVSIYLGDGQGGFRFGTRVAVGHVPLAILDWAGDLVVANSGSNDVTLLFGHGDGVTFDTATVPVGLAPVALAIDDITEDGYPDLAVVDQGSGDVLILEFWQNAKYGGYPSYLPPIFVGDGPRSIAIDFLDRAFSRDMVVAGDFGVRVLLNQGSPHSWDVRPVPGVGPAESVIVWEYTADGVEDLGVGTEDGILVLPGYEDGTFGPPQRLTEGPPVRQLRVQHFDTVGFWDLLSVNARGCCDSGSLTIVPLGDHGRFGTPLTFGQAAAPGRMAVGDVNGDLRRDVAVTIPGANSVAVILGRGDGTFLTDTRLPIGDPARHARAVAVDDFDQDGRPDLAVGDLGFVQVQTGRGDGTFINPVVTTVAGVATSLAADDLNGDGVRDLVVAARSFDPGAGSVAVLLGNGDGSFDPGPILTAGSSPAAVATGDFDRDGHKDLVVADLNSNHVMAFFGTGDGSFGAQWVIITARPPTSVVACDMDGDGDDDVALTIPGAPGDVSVYLSSGSGFFIPAASYRSGEDPADLVCADLDGDGHVDLAAANALSSHVSVFHGLGDGSFASARFFPAGDSANAIAAADMDGDGHIDLATSHDAGYVSVLLGRGDGTFAPPARFAEWGSTSIAATDFNADGRADLALGVGHGAAVLLSQPPPDADRDGIPDRVDTCTDTDGDGFGDPDYPARTCARDNCGSVFNPGQEDGDGDDIGDICDACPLDRYNDEDGDGFCADVDNCRWIYDPDQEPGPDADGDGKLDACDNCPNVPNSDQADRNFDDWGDACQPEVRILDIQQDGGEELEVTVLARDPQGEALSGNISFAARDDIRLGGAAAGGPSCADATFPRFHSGEGLAYAIGEDGSGVLYDLDSRFHCADGLQDYEIAFGVQQGDCTAETTVFTSSLVIRNDQMQLLCVRRVADPRSQIEMVAFTDGDDFVAQYFGFLDVPFASTLPERVDISPLLPGIEYGLGIDATDGNAGYGYDSALFLYQGERVMVLRRPAGPRAVISAPASVECLGAGKGPVTLDGSTSLPGDAGAAIVAFEWFLHFGEPSQMSLGAGAVLGIDLPLGQNAVTLRVTDANGESGTATATVVVLDTHAPFLEITMDSSVLWPPNHRLVPVQATIQVRDACDPAPVVSLVSVLSSEPDNAQGSGDGNTVGDIAEASLGTPDGSLLLRAERATDGPGRTYTLTYSARDASGNTTSALAVVRVPHDLGSGPEPLLLNVEPAGSAGIAHIYWAAVPEARFYDVIVGRLEDLRMQADRISLGTVRVLAAGVPAPSATEDAASIMPALGQGFFFVAQSRGPDGASGYGTESAPLPSEPASCAGGCPGIATAIATSDGSHKR